MKTDIILFNPDTRLKKRIWMPNLPLCFLPMSLLAVSAPLVKAGFKVKIIDQRVEPDWKKALLTELKKEPLCIGVTVMTGPVVGCALEVSRFVRENSNIPIVWGGVHPSLLPEQTIENPNIDIVVKGEGEEAFLELVNAIANKASLDKVKGIYYKQDSRIKNTGLRSYIDLNKQPPYPYHLINMKNYILEGPGYRIVEFSSSRGCFFKCSFCSNRYYEPGHWTALSAEETLNRVRQLREDYDVNGILFRDENFFLNIERATNIFQNFIKDNFNKPFHDLRIRADTLSKFDNGYLRFLEEAGVMSLFIGVESGSQKILKLLNKGIDVPEVVSINRRISQLHFYPHYSFMIGLPTETREDLQQTIRLYLRLLEENKKANGMFCIYSPRIGTELLNFSLKCGLKIPQKLEEWTNYPYTHSDPGNNKPWISKQKRKLLMNIRFCSIVIFYAKTYIYFDKTSLLLFRYFSQLAAKICFPLALRRLRNFNFRLFIEKYIIDFIVGKY